jgi:hypothetical protein
VRNPQCFDKPTTLRPLAGARRSNEHNPHR